MFVNKEQWIPMEPFLLTVGILLVAGIAFYWIFRPLFRRPKLGDDWDSMTEWQLHLNEEHRPGQYKRRCRYC